MKGKVSEQMVKNVFILEVVLALFIVIGVIIGSTDLFRYFKIIFETPRWRPFRCYRHFSIIR